MRRNCLTRIDTWPAHAALGLILGLILALGTTTDSRACSDVILDKSKTLGGEVSSARTLDFPGTYYWGTELVRVPRGIHWTSNNYSLYLNNKSKGRQWQNQYGFIGVDFLGKLAKEIVDRRVFFDGMNEKGLSAAWLWLDENRFPVPDEHRFYDPEGLLYLDLVAWILGQYQSVPEVKQALLDTQGHINSALILEFPDVGGPPLFPLHLVVHDASGHSLIAEWHDDHDGHPYMHLYDGPDVDTVGVMTNSPVYMDQIKRIRKFRDLTNEDGLAGLPGGYDSKSRFIRLYKLREFLDKPTNPPDPETVSAAAEALHAINSVDVGLGVDYDPFFEDPEDNPFFYQYTGVTLVRDHSNRILYFKGVHNQELRKIDLRAVNFAIPWKGWNTETDLPADIRPSESNRYTQAVDMTAQITAPEYRYYFKASDPFHYRLDLDVTVEVAAADQGKSGKYFVYGIDRNNSFWNWTGTESGWQQVPREALASCAEGALKSTKFRDVFSDASATDWKGFRVFAGYGSSAMDMLLGGTVREVFMVETEPRFQGDPPINFDWARALARWKASPIN